MIVLRQGWDHKQMPGTVRCEYIIDVRISVVKRPSPRSKPRAIERTSAQRAGWLRLTRTIALGTIATAVALVWIGEQYGIERKVMLEFLATSALFVGLLVVAGLLGAVVLWLLRKLLRKD